MVPFHLVWSEVSDLRSDKVHRDSFSSLVYERCFTPNLLQRSRWEQGGGNQYLLTAVSGSVRWDPSLQARGALWSSVSLSHLRELGHNSHNEPQSD